MTAAEALRKARATMECNDRWFEDCTCGAYMYHEGRYHTGTASALLDGFTVEELTEAGG